MLGSLITEAALIKASLNIAGLGRMAKMNLESKTYSVPCLLKDSPPVALGAPYRTIS